MVYLYPSLAQNIEYCIYNSLVIVGCKSAFWLSRCWGWCGRVHYWFSPPIYGLTCLSVPGPAVWHVSYKKIPSFLVTWRGPEINIFWRHFINILRPMFVLPFCTHYKHANLNFIRENMCRKMSFVSKLNALHCMVVR